MESIDLKGGDDEVLAHDQDSLVDACLEMATPTGMEELARRHTRETRDLTQMIRAHASAAEASHKALRSGMPAARAPAQAGPAVGQGRGLDDPGPRDGPSPEPPSREGRPSWMQRLRGHSDRAARTQGTLAASLRSGPAATLEAAGEEYARLSARACKAWSTRAEAYSRALRAAESSRAAHGDAVAKADAALKTAAAAMAAQDGAAPRGFRDGVRPTVADGGAGPTAGDAALLAFDALSHGEGIGAALSTLTQHALASTGVAARPVPPKPRDLAMLAFRSLARAVRARAGARAASVDAHAKAAAARAELVRVRREALAAFVSADEARAVACDAAVASCMELLSQASASLRVSAADALGDDAAGEARGAAVRTVRTLARGALDDDDAFARIRTSGVPCDAGIAPPPVFEEMGQRVPVPLALRGYMSQFRRAKDGAPSNEGAVADAEHGASVDGGDGGRGSGRADGAGATGQDAQAAAASAAGSAARVSVATAPPSADPDVAAADPGAAGRVAELLERAFLSDGDAAASRDGGAAGDGGDEEGHAAALAAIESDGAVQLYMLHVLNHLRQSPALPSERGFHALCDAARACLRGAVALGNYRAVRQLVNMTGTFYHSLSGAERFYLQDELRSDPVWAEDPRLWEELFYDAVQAEQRSFRAAGADGGHDQGHGHGHGHGHDDGDGHVGGAADATSSAVRDDEDAALPSIALSKIIPFAWGMGEHGVAQERIVAFVERMCGVHGIADDDRDMVLAQVRAAAAAHATQAGAADRAAPDAAGVGDGDGGDDPARHARGSGTRGEDRDDPDPAATFEGTFDEKMQLCRHLKEIGNSLFRDGQFLQAAQQYAKALRLTGNVAAIEGLSDRKRAEALTLSCHLNASACALQEHEPFTAQNHAQRALAIDPRNVKARFRLGLALARQGKVVAAIRQLRFVQRKTPDDEHLVRELDDLVHLVRLARLIGVAGRPDGTANLG